MQYPTYYEAILIQKYRDVSHRFDSGADTAELVNVSKIFSDDEQKMILECARQLGMDVGELDVLRDNADGKIYVVDANKTSVSPPMALSPTERLRYLQLIGEAFFNAFLAQGCYRRISPHGMMFFE